MNAGGEVLKKVDVNDVIKRIIPMFTEQYKTRKFVQKLNSSLPPARLDEDKFQQILTNLIDNAAKYAADGKSVTISTELVENFVEMKITDEGVGIKKADFDKVFKKFSRLENHLTSTTQGNGLGLYITKQLVENMGGQISFTSEINKGTTFRVLMPVYNQEEVLRCSHKS